MNEATASRGLQRVLVGFLVSAAVVAGADDVPRLDLDAPGALARLEEAPTRARWLFESADATFDPRSVATAEGVEVVGRLRDVGRAWILEADARDVTTVESLWSGRGVLRRDVSGVPTLVETTAMVGVRPTVWGELEIFGDATSTVAILDSGCDTAHDDLGDPSDDDVDDPPAAGDADDWSDVVDGFDGDLRRRVVGWHDVTDDLPGAVGPWDYHHHGTALASAAFGSGRREDVARGVAPGGRFAVVKTWNFEGRWERWASDLLLGMQWVLDNADRLDVRAVLIGATWPEDFGFGAAVEALNSRGIVVIAPAGNDPEEPMGYPARTPGVLTVGAAGPQGRVADYSTSAPLDTAAVVLDLIAPGGSALDANGRVRVADNEPQDGYALRFGTSIAAAHVAGAVSIVSDAMRAVGTTWSRDVDQARTIADLLRITAAPTGAATTPNPREGYGLLQVRGAVDVLREVLWPGDDVSFFLEDPVDGEAVRAARIPVTPGQRLRIELDPAANGDADLFVYRESPTGYEMLGRSQHAGDARKESVTLESPVDGWVVAVAQRVSGAGTTTLRVVHADPALAGWSLQMSALQRTSPTAADVDGDGRDEVVVTNNLQLSADAHRLFVVEADGSDTGFFPEQYFTPGQPGEFTTPTIGTLGAGTSLLIGSEFGLLFAIDANADTRWTARIGVGATTPPVLVDPGASAWVAVGGATGVVGVDAAGLEILTVPTPAPVTRALAAGDVAGDARQEVVAVDEQGNVWVVDATGDVVDGWPRVVASEATPPVLRGDGTGPRIAEIAVADLGVDAVARLHRWRPDGSVVGTGAIVLDTDGRPVREVSPLALGRLRVGESPVYVVATLSGGNAAPIAARLHLIGLDGSQQVLERVYATARFEDASLSFYRRRLGEPRVAEVTGGGAREILVPVVVGWSDERAGSELRYGLVHEIVRWQLDGPTTGRAIALPRVRFPDLLPLAPLLVDLDGDGRPEWVTPRDNRLDVLRGAMPEDVATTWADARGDDARSACFECRAIDPVAAPPASRGPATLTARPNPFNPRTVLRADLLPDAEVTWTVVDARGRVVRRTTSRSDATGRADWIFDGADARGRPLASGVYHVEARAVGVPVGTRIVLVR